MEKNFIIFIPTLCQINYYFCQIGNTFSLVDKISNYKYSINFKNKNNIKINLVYNISNHKYLFNFNSKKIKNFKSILYIYKYYIRKMEDL